MNVIKNKVIILGSGSAGYTASIYLARANFNPIVITGEEEGGQLMVTTDVENYPGFEEITGPELMSKMRSHAEKFNVQIINDHINKFEIQKDLITGSHKFVMHGYVDKYESEAAIIATGATAKWLGIESEKKFRGFGVSGCATCDAMFFKDKVVAVVGGGNTAAEEALFLTHHAKKVYLVHRRDSMKAEKILQDRLACNPKIEFIWNSIVDEILGDEVPRKNVTGLRIKSIVSGVITDLKLDGVFIAIGHHPNSKIVANHLDIDSDGYIITNGKTSMTNIDGLFACGDVQDKIYRQAITASGSGCMAALDAERYLSSRAANTNNALDKYGHDEVKKTAFTQDYSS